MPEFDYILVGGGLQNGLIAAALRARQPSARVALVERDGNLGGNHTWCFHDTDVDEGCLDWLEPFVSHRWSGYRVEFPGFSRTIDGGYSAITSRGLHTVVSLAIRDHQSSRLLLNEEVRSVGRDQVTLSSGESLHGTVVVDGRGLLADEVDHAAGYQKFIGLEIELEGAHDLDRPILMDARVDQSAGYRFFYVLPLSATRLLVEDTYFHQSPSLDVDRVRDEVLDYVTSRGWRTRDVVREEVGVLPMPWSRAGLSRGAAAPLAAGYRGGWFHPGTGYSLPVAVRLAGFVAARPPSELFGPELQRMARRHMSQVTYAHLLNRFLFRWFPPKDRWAIFERFYRLPEATIGHFYALRLTWLDRLRLLLGRPPGGLSLGYRLRHGARE
jgi:lycopene beta-cyclase